MKIKTNTFLKRLVIFPLVIILCTTGVFLLPSVTACPGGMVSCWALDETEGLIAHDSINGNDGTLYCVPTWNAPGVVNTALSFDGTGDRVVIPDSTSLHFSSFTVMAWAKAEGNFGMYRSILTKDQQDQSEFWFGYADNNKLDFKFNGQGGENINGASQRIITDSDWHFLVGVYDGSTIMVYVDGALDGSKLYGPMTVGTGTLNMGMTFYWGDNWFQGILDEVAVFNYALTPTEISSYYQMGVDGRSYCVEPPVADPNGPYTGNCGELILFDGSGSYDPDGTIVSYEWDFGDGNTGSGVNPSHTYASGGVYTVTLLVTDDDGLTDTEVTTADISCCSTNLAVNKTVWDGSNWVDNIRVANGTKVKFKLTITDNGDCPLSYLTVIDYLSTPQLKYLYESSITPIFAADNEVQWRITTLTSGQTIEITYNATTIHTCYGWNSVYVKNDKGIVIGYDLAHVKVVNDAGQPALAVSTMVWDDGQSTWNDHATLKINEKLTFKITITSTALTTVHDVTITDLLPALVTYNYDATLTPASASNNEVIWNIGDLSPGDEIEITLTTTTIAMGTDYTTASVISYEGFSDQDYVLLQMESAAPSMLLIYPLGGETLQGSVTIEWSASDDNDGRILPIYIYFKDIDDTVWSTFPGNPYQNMGQLTWDTTRIPDGSYQVQINTQDSSNNVVTVTSDQFQIKNTETPSDNLVPETPGVPSGQAHGKFWVDYTYATSTVDPEGDQVYYLWDWGDGTQNEWLGPYNSGTTISTTHWWAATGSYNIKVKAKDINGHESSWSNPLPIAMRYTFNNPIWQFLESLFERFPNLFPILQQLLGY
ncbi:Concanavalin A-like lectin/glucanases superfamily protein [uncultured archaeon]|nr:Concanavalin A-like lectin/glucanases superfamily protein [uncultured archaeon]